MWSSAVASANTDKSLRHSQGRESEGRFGLGQTLCAAQVVTASLAFIWSSSPSTTTFFCMLNTPCWYLHTHTYRYICPTYSGSAHPEYFFHTEINFCAKSAGLNEGRILKLSMLCVFWREFTGTESMTMTVTHWETQGSPLKWNLKSLEKWTCKFPSLSKKNPKKQDNQPRNR